MTPGIPSAARAPRPGSAAVTADPLLRDIGRRIGDARRARGSRQADLAAAVGTTQQLVSHYENGTAAPSLLMLVRIAHVLDVDVATLLDGEGS